MELKCQNCGVVGLFSSEMQAFNDGWDFPPFSMVVTCGKCPSAPLVVPACCDREIEREPADHAPAPPPAMQEVDDAFKFSAGALSDAQALACARLEKYAKDLAYDIVRTVPEGKCRTVAINNILGALLWARHGIVSEGEVQLVSVTPQE